MTRILSPCIDVCKFRREGHCIGCSMTKHQKSMFKKLKKETHQKAFLDLLVHQQNDMGKFSHWREAYRRRCAKKGVTPLV